MQRGKRHMSLRSFLSIRNALKPNQMQYPSQSSSTKLRIKSHLRTFRIDNPYLVAKHFRVALELQPPDDDHTEGVSSLGLHQDKAQNSLFLFLTGNSVSVCTTNHSIGRQNTPQRWVHYNYNYNNYAMLCWSATNCSAGFKYVAFILLH